MAERIIVLGTMRSGTSLTAELTRLWGAYAGPEKDLWKSDFGNPRGYGYMEYIPLQEFNDELLDHNDRLPPLVELMEEKARNEAYRKQALELLRQMDEQAARNQAPAWVWKDARLPLTLPFWMKIWDDVTYVITVRHPIEITLSAARAQEFQEENPPFSAGLLYWQYCMVNVLTYTQNSAKKIFMAYDQLITNPYQESARLCEFLDRQCQVSAETAEQRKNQMHTKVAENQRHYQYQKSLAEVREATREQRALYNFLRVKTLYPDEAFNRSDFELYPGWQEFLQSMDMLLMLSDKLQTWATQPPILEDEP